MNYSNVIKKKDLLLNKKNFFYGILIIIIFSLDRISKIKVLSEFSDSVYFVNNFINIDLIWNIGIGFGFFSTDSSIFYNLISLLIITIIFVLFYIFVKSENLDKLIYSIIIGGALGNFYDRLIYKAVPDFIDIHYNNFHWFTFNVADIFITLGILFFIIRSFLLKIKI